MARIYVACLASYNAGVLHGRWIDLDDKEADEVNAEIAAMLRESPCPNVEVECPECGGHGMGSHVASCLSDERRPCPICEGRGSVPSAEEWAVHDYDGLPSSFGEYPSLALLLAYAEAAKEHGEPFRIWWKYEFRNEVDTEAFREAYIGTFDSERDWVERYVEEVGLLAGLPEYVARYFDFDAYLRDLKLGDYWTERGSAGVHVFRST